MITISRNFARILTDYVGRLQNHEFSEAAMAMAAAIIWADGHLHATEQAKLEWIVCQLEHMPRDRDALDLGTHYRDGVSRPQETKVTMSQRMEGVGSGPSHRHVRV